MEKKKQQKTKENNRNKTAIRLIGKGKERKELYFIVNSSSAEAEVWGIVN